MQPGLIFGSSTGRALSRRRCRRPSCWTADLPLHQDGQDGLGGFTVSAGVARHGIFRHQASATRAWTRGDNRPQRRVPSRGWCRLSRPDQPPAIPLNLPTSTNWLHRVTAHWTHCGRLAGRPALLSPKPNSWVNGEHRRTVFHGFAQAFLLGGFLGFPTKFLLRVRTPFIHSVHLPAAPAWRPECYDGVRGAGRGRRFNIINGWHSAGGDLTALSWRCSAGPWRR